MTSNSSRKFATFATYVRPQVCAEVPTELLSQTPPPDEPGLPNTSPTPRQAWFPNMASTSSIPSYQSGGLPVYTSQQPTSDINVGGEDLESSNPWTTTFGWRVDVVAAVAYLGGPLTGQFPRGSSPNSYNLYSQLFYY